MNMQCQANNMYLGKDSEYSKRPTFLNLQYLRAFAAINVVLFHIIGAAADYKPSVNYLKMLQGWGANGVDIFFVISGFVMYHTQYTKKSSPIQFLKLRFIRIAPLYYFLTLLIIVSSFLIPAAFRSLDLSLQWSLASFAFSSQLINSSFPIIYVGWTLEWEMMFYAIFALSLFFKDWKKSIISVVILLISASAISNNLIVLEFILGLFCGYLIGNVKIGKKQGLAIFVIGALSLSMSILDIISEMQFDRFIIWGIPSFLIVTGLIYCRQIHLKLFLYLGDASYSIYLSQVFTISIFYKIASKFTPEANGDLIALICLTVSILSGCFLYSFIEKPMTATLRRRAA